VSKYQSVDEAVKWSVGLLKAVLVHEFNHWTNWADSAESNEKFLKDFAGKLENKLVKKIDSRTKENSGKVKRVRDLFNSHGDFYRRVSLRDSINETLVELKVSPLPDYVVDDKSYVTSTYFAGFSTFSKSHKNAEYGLNKQKNTFGTKIKRNITQIIR